MSSDHREPNRDTTRLEALLTRWFEAVESDSQPTIEKFCAEDRDLEEDFRRIVATDLDFSASLGGADERESTDARRRIQDYELLTMLGSGGRGEVWLARQMSLGRFVAIKLLRDETATVEKSRRRLLREAELAASLEHPNIVPVYGVGEDETGTPFLAMRWLSGPALDDLDHPLEPKRIAEIGATIARALHAAHLAGITHRDVKPANIMLDGETPYVLDFGLARGETDLTMTVEGKVSGTLPYMSPEQLCSGGKSTPLDGRTDVYSLGVSLYELLEGNPPFDEDEPGVLIQRILLTGAPPPKRCDTDLRTILMRTLEKDPNDRFATAEDLADDLERYCRGEPIVSRPVGWIERGVKLVRRHRIASAVIGAALLATLIVATVLFVRIRRDAENRTADAREIRTALDASNPIRAEQLLETFRVRYPQDARLTDLSRELRADQLVNEVLDRLQQSPINANREAISDLVDKVDALDAFVARPAQRRLWELTRATALAWAKRVEAAKLALSEIDSKYAKAVLEAWIEGRTWPWSLPPSDADDAMEHLIVSLVMRAADVPRDAQLAEIRKGLNKTETDYRLRWQELIWLANHRDDPERVLTGLRGLLSEDRYLRPVRGAMLSEARKIGKRPIIEKYLELLRTEYPRSTWTEDQAAVVAATFETLARSKELDEILNWSRPKWPESSTLALIDARYAAGIGAAGRYAKAIADAKRTAKNQRQRDASALLELSNEMARETTTPRARALEKVADELSKSAEDPNVRAHATLLLVESVLARRPNTPARPILVRLDQATKEAAKPPILIKAAHLALAVGSAERADRYLRGFDEQIRSGVTIQPELELESFVVRAYAADAKNDTSARDEAIDRALGYRRAQLTPAHADALRGLRSGK